MADARVPEEWRLVTDWPDYEVSNLGKIRRAAPTYWTNPQNGLRYVKYPAGRPLRPSPDPDGYLTVTLVRNKKRRTKRICALVCAAFHGQRPSNKHQVAHGDGQNTNDVSSNLRWATPRENIEDAIQHGTWIRGERNGNAILTANHVREIRDRLATGETISDLALFFGVSKPTIDAVRARRNWKHI